MLSNDENYMVLQYIFGQVFNLNDIKRRILISKRKIILPNI